jgi:hypothetical protein
MGASESNMDLKQYILWMVPHVMAFANKKVDMSFLVLEHVASHLSGSLWGYSTVNARRSDNAWNVFTLPRSASRWVNATHQLCSHTHPY